MLPDQALVERHFHELSESVLAARVRPTPNPKVGARLITDGGELIAEGIHGTDGIKHAEVIAIERAGKKAAGSHALVTLEPCSHFGRTPPCVDALLSAGVSSVWFSHSDPTSAGGGAARLREAGVAVFGGLVTSVTKPSLEPWLHYQSTGLPFVTLKLAATLDGYVAAPDGTSRWITGAVARQYVHRLRSQADAVLVGTGTVLVDNPALDVRLDGDWPQPRVVVLGERDLPSGLLIEGRYLHMRHRDIHRALRELADEGIQHVLVEGGSKVATEFLKADAVDRLVWFVAPKLLGGGLPAVTGLGIPSIDFAQQWRVLNLDQIGEDVAIDLRRERPAD